MDIKNEIRKSHEELLRLRRDFHAHPELGFREFRTSRIVEEHLEELGLEVRRCAGTGVVGVLRGSGPGKTILLRCDMDALPIEEATGLPFCSLEPGVMHACGHDGHIAMLMVAARILVGHRGEFPGAIVFLFQPNEEEAGAELMIEDGALENPRPDAVCGAHLWSLLPTGVIGVGSGPLMASSYYFKLTICGKGGHGGSPHAAVNPIDAASHVLEAIKTLHTLEFDSLRPTVISVCTLHAGVKAIVVPETLEMEGSIRCLHDGDEEVRRRFSELVEGVCRLYRCTCDVAFRCGNTMLNNNGEMSELARIAAETVVGSENVRTRDLSVMLGEDFAEFSRRIPGVFYFIGTGNESKGTNIAHHHPRFDIDEDSLSIGVEMHVRLALEYLNQAVCTIRRSVSV